MLKFNCGLIVALLLTISGFSHPEKCTCEETEYKSPHRPQEPTRPYPYDEEEVSFENSAAGVTLAGTLTLPQSQGPFPVVILLHGSAPLDRDSSIFDHKPFLVWADYLTRQGIAVLRFDKRSAGKSTGDYSTATLEDFANDALAGVEYLKTRKEINSNQIGLIGHSEGGMTATLAASKSADIAFIVLLAAPGVNFAELIDTQETLIQRADGASEEAISQNQQVRSQIFTVLKEEKSTEIAGMKIRDILTKYFSNLTPSQEKLTETYYGIIEEKVIFFNSTWFRYGLTYDPMTILKQIKIPILALNGERDLIVSSEQNLRKIAKTLEEVNHADHTTIELPKLNHAFQSCQTGLVTEVANIEETASPLFLKIMTDWILEKVQLKQDN